MLKKTLIIVVLLLMANMAVSQETAFKWKAIRVLMDSTWNSPEEPVVKGIIDYSLNDWYKLQIDFLGNHNYYTQTNRTKRDEGKRLNLIQIKSLFNQE